MFDEEKDANDAGSSTADVTTETEAPATDAATPAEAIKTEKQPTDASGQTIPYDRFQEVVEQRNEATRLYKEYEARLKSFEQNKTAQPPALVKPKFNDPATQAFYEAAIAPLEEQAKKALELAETTQSQTRAEQQASQIMSEINSLTVQFPKADKEWVINTLIGNPKKGIAELVKYSHSKNEAYEKKIIADYVKVKQEEAKHKAKSPSGSAPAAKSPSVKGKSWNEQLKNASDTFREKLSAQD